MQNFTSIHVNFNSSDLTINCINSILEFEKQATIIIVDNGSNQIEKDKLNKWIENNGFNTTNIHFLFEPSNLGYFGALNKGLEFIRDEIDKYEFVLVGNNDLLFDESFFTVLKNVDVESDVYVLAPNIIKSNGVHQNPYAIKKTSKIRKLFYRIFYFHYYLAKIILFLTKIFGLMKSDMDRSDFKTTQLIYAGHGSCYILTKSYFSNNFLLNNPTFLMGEEFVFAKQIRDTKGKIKYISNLKVLHNEHSSMNKIPSKVVYKYMQSTHKQFKNLY